MGKIFLILAIICSVTAAVFGFLLGTQKDQYAAMLASAEKSLGEINESKYSGTDKFKLNPENKVLISSSIKNVGTALKETQDTLAATQATLAETEKKLSEEQTKVLDLTTKLTETTTKLETAQTQLADAQGKLQTVSAELDGIKKELGNDSISGLRSQIADYAEKASNLDGQVNALTLQKTDLEGKVADLEAKLNYKTTATAPLELDCKVVAINKQWNFVVLDAGKSKNLFEGVEMTIYRGKEFVGKVKTVSVDEETSVADILPEWAKSEIQVGDQALF